MFHKLHRMSLGVSLTLILLLLLTQLILSFDPYWLSQRQMRSIARQNPTLPTDLATYSALAKEAKTAVPTSLIHLVAAPLSGVRESDMWQPLMWLANKKALGASVVLAEMQSATQQFAQQDVALMYLAQSDTLVQPLQQLQQGQPLSPTQLQAIAQSSQRAAAALATSQQTLSFIAQRLEQFTSSEGYNSMLYDVQLRIESPGFFSQLASFLAGTDVPTWLYQEMLELRALPATLQQQATQMARHIHTLEQLSWWYFLGERTDETLHALYIPQTAVAVDRHAAAWLTCLSFAIGLSLGGWVGAALMEAPQIAPGRRQAVVRLAQQIQTNVQLVPRQAARRRQPPQATAVAPHTPTSVVCSWTNGAMTTLWLPPTGQLTIGGHVENDIGIDQVYARHTVAVIRRARNVYFLQRFDSTMPVWHNSQLVRDARQLRAGDTIHLANVHLVLLHPTHTQ